MIFFAYYVWPAFIAMVSINNGVASLYVKAELGFISLHKAKITH